MVELKAHERGQKLWDAYVKYLLSYDTLSEEEKQTLDKQVTSEWQRKNKSASDDCMVKVSDLSVAVGCLLSKNALTMLIVSTKIYDCEKAKPCNSYLL